MRSIISIGQVLYMAGIILKAVDAIAQFQVDYAQLRHQLSYLNAFYDFLHLPNMHYERFPLKSGMTENTSLNSVMFPSVIRNRKTMSCMT